MGKWETAAVRTAVSLFGIGLLALLALFLTPVLANGHTAPTWVYILTPLVPIGLVVGVVGVVLSNHTRDS